jgi:hypothetical protein
MGPSQGFIPFGTTLDQYVNDAKNNITHNFYDLIRVDKKDVASEYK